MTIMTSVERRLLGNYNAMVSNVTSNITASIFISGHSLTICDCGVFV